MGIIKSGFETVGTVLGGAWDTGTKLFSGDFSGAWETVKDTGASLVGDFVSAPVSILDPLDLTGLKTLVVDDNNVNLKLASRILKQFNLDITTATNGQECIDLVKKEDFDIIFLDHMMPGLDGIETVHILRENGNEMPIIALTANSYSGSRDKYIEEGFTDYLPKPFQYKELNKILKKYMGQ